jgi:hypothetical protein
MAALSALGWLLPFPLTDLVLSAAARYWDGCEIGINAAANSFTLLYLVGPVLLLGLYAVGGLGYVVGPRVLGRDEAWSALLAAAATLSSLRCLGGQPGERLEPGRRPEALGAAHGGDQQRRADLGDAGQAAGQLVGLDLTVGPLTRSLVGPLFGQHAAE